MEPRARAGPSGTRRLAVLGLLAGALTPTRPAAAPAALRYDVVVGGARLARAEFASEARGDTIVSRLTVGGAGLGALLGTTDHTLRSTSAVTRAGLRPRSFDAREVKRDRTREIAIRYVDGAIASFVYLNQGQQRPSDVPERLRAGTLDPLTAVLTLRQWVPATAQDGAPARLVLPVFDGRKRFDLTARRLDSDLRHHVLRVQLVALHGFDEDDALVTFPGEADGRWLHVLATGADEPVPVRIETRNTRVATTVRLVAG
jgi:hypothetical protein